MGVVLGLQRAETAAIPNRVIDHTEFRDRESFDAALAEAFLAKADELIRDKNHRWDPKNQRPELWNLYNSRVNKGESIRVFPLSNWTELDVWQYIHLEKIPIVPLYFAAHRPVVERGGQVGYGVEGLGPVESIGAAVVDLSGSFGMWIATAFETDEAVEAMRSNLGADHPVTIESEGALAIALGAKREFQAAERVLLETFPDEIETVVSRTGRAEIATDPMGIEVSDIFVILKPKDEWRFGSKDELIAAMKDSLESKIPANNFSFTQPIELRVQELIAGVRLDIGISLYGDDLDTLKDVGNKIATVVSQVPGAADVQAELARTRAVAQRLKETKVPIGVRLA